MVVVRTRNFPSLAVRTRARLNPPPIPLILARYYITLRVSLPPRWCAKPGLPGETGDPAGKSHCGPPLLKAAMVLQYQITSPAALKHGQLMTT